MQYWTEQETKRLLAAAYEANRNHHLAILTGLAFGLRVSETLAIRAKDVDAGQLYVKRLKGSNATLQDIFPHENPLFDCSPLLERAARAKPHDRLFPWSRQRMDERIKHYAKVAGLHFKKAHYHAAKHTAAMMIFGQSQSIGELQNILGHKSASSSLVYLREMEQKKGINSRNAALNALAS